MPKKKFNIWLVLVLVLLLGGVAVLTIMENRQSAFLAAADDDGDHDHGQGGSAGAPPAQSAPMAPGGPAK